MKEKVLKSYLLALESNNNWFRPKYYAIYRVSPSGSQFLGVSLVDP